MHKKNQRDILGSKDLFKVVDVTGAAPAQKSMYDLIDSILSVGKFLRLCSFKIQKLEIIKMRSLGSVDKVHLYNLITSGYSRVFSFIFKLILTAYMVFLVLQEKGKHNVKLFVMNWLWRSTFCLFALYICTILWALEYRRSQWILIFQKSDTVHAIFNRLGCILNTNLLKRIAVGMILFHLLYAGIHCWLARILNKREHSLLVLLKKHDVEGLQGSLNTTVAFALVGTTFVLDYMCWFTWHFADILRISLAMYMWILYSSLNRTINNLHMQPASVVEVIQLHLRISGLLRSINEAINPITFVGTLFAVVYSFFYINYFLAGYNNPIRHVLFAHFMLKNMLLYLVSAQVNAKAHGISEWLEKIAGNQNIAEIVESPCLSQLMIFISQIYTKDAIGFTGYEFFTITTSFISTVVSVVMTYTIVIVQLSSQIGS